MTHTPPCALEGQYIHFHNPVSFQWMVTEGMLPFQGAGRGMPLHTRGVATGLGYVGLSALRRYC
ncbi:MAG: hypothetical protein LBL42_02240 [Tannerella sp.]|jgi:hypothetical protein|nr:hypothetical protein [Tannerella sp.]